MSGKKYYLSKKDIQSIFACGGSAKTVAKHYGCSTSLVYNFCKDNKIEIPKLDLVGHKFNQFTVLKKIGSRGQPGRQSIYWLCQCECGNTRELPTKSINRGDCKSCGCYMKSKEYSRSNYLWNGHGDIHGKWWGNVKKGAQRRGHSFDISIEEAWKIYQKQDGKCALSGVDIVFADSSYGFQHGETTASLDRKNNNKGYTKNNVHWVHKDVNLMKQKMSQKELLDWCKLIVEYNGVNNEI